MALDLGNPVGFVKEGFGKLQGAIQAVITPDNPEQTAQKIKDQKKYSYNYLTYPSNLGEDTRHPHYITFFVNIQELSKFKNDPSGKSLVPLNDRGVKVHSTIAVNQASQPSLARNVTMGGTTFGFGRKTIRTKTAIRIYMPDTLSWSYENQYEGVALSGTFAGQFLGATALAAGAVKSAVDAAQSGGRPGPLPDIMTNERKGALGEFGAGVLLGDEKLGLSSFGIARNPQIDVIYDSPQLRSFNFEFMFAPRSKDEGRVMQEILKTFKFHSAPEILSDGGVFGRYFVPPSEFDIEFSVNSMGKISTCVLESATIDYGATGSAFYKDGTPVHTRLNLRFKELEYITKDLIRDRGY